MALSLRLSASAGLRETIPSRRESASFIEDDYPTVGISYSPVEDDVTPPADPCLRYSFNRIPEGVRYCHLYQCGVASSDDRVRGERATS